MTSCSEISAKQTLGLEGPQYLGTTMQAQQALAGSSGVQVARSGVIPPVHSDQTMLTLALQYLVVVDRHLGQLSRMAQI
jgi:hypothetical protein